MRISDWSSDVCSSDLKGGGAAKVSARGELHRLGRGGPADRFAAAHFANEAALAGRLELAAQLHRVGAALQAVGGQAIEGVAVHRRGVARRRKGGKDRKSTRLNSSH